MAKLRVILNRFKLRVKELLSFPQIITTGVYMNN